MTQVLSQAKPVTAASGEYPQDFCYALGRPQASGLIRADAADFQVTEDLGFELTGAGEHHYLFIEKTRLNTPDVAARLARWSGVRTMDIGYAGLKDRHAVTRQWFSVYLPTVQVPDWQGLQDRQLSILAVGRHSRKLRRGAHRSNRFVIRIGGLQGDTGWLKDRIAAIADQGVPNYFGPQRFGRAGANLVAAERMLVAGKRVTDRRKRGLYLSAARSYLFNRLLSKRVSLGNWALGQPGDIMQSVGFDQVREVPTGPLWGRGRLASQAGVLLLESDIPAGYPALCHGLEHRGLKQERRPLALGVDELEADIGQREMLLKFRLPVGAYATSVLRELVSYTDVTAGNRPPPEQLRNSN